MTRHSKVLLLVPLLATAVLACKDAGQRPEAASSKSSDLPFEGVWVSDCKATGKSSSHRRYVTFTADREVIESKDFSELKCDPATLIGVRTESNLLKLEEQPETADGDRLFHVEVTLESHTLRFLSEKIVKQANAEETYGRTDWEVGIDRDVNGLTRDNKPGKWANGDVQYTSYLVKKNVVLYAADATATLDMSSPEKRPVASSGSTTFVREK